MQSADRSRRLRSRSLRVEHLEPRLPAAQVGPAALADFSYIDLNPASDTAGETVSPRQFVGKMSAWYFAHAGCSYCTAQFNYLNTLQQELSTAHPLLSFNIAGVNEAGFQAGDPPPIVADKTLPWVQDVDGDADSDSDIWDAWDVNFRDLVILDESNEKITVYNLTDHNLAEQANFLELRTMLIDAAMDAQLPYHNAANPFDCNGDGGVGPLDALLVINDLNANGARRFSAPVGTTAPAIRTDVNADNNASPLDALQVINHLNAQSSL